MPREVTPAEGGALLGARVDLADDARARSADGDGEVLETHGGRWWVSFVGDETCVGRLMDSCVLGGNSIALGDGERSDVSFDVVS